MSKRRKEQVKGKRERERGKKRHRKARRTKRTSRRKGRGKRKERWCRVSSEATNTKVVRTWKEGRGQRGTTGSSSAAGKEVPVRRQNVVKSAGDRGYKNMRHRGTDYAARKVVGRARKQCKRKVKGKVGVHVRREGTGKGSKARRKRVTQKNRKLRSVSDRTREAHNGCKGKKARRR